MCGTSSRYSHTAVFARYPDGSLYLHHSTPNPGKLVGLGDSEPSYGVMATKLEDKLQSGWFIDCAVRCLRKPLTEEERDKCFAFFVQQQDKNNEQDMSELAYWAIDITCCGIDCCLNKEDNSSYFCREFVAAALQSTGRVIFKVPVNEMTPQDFASSSSQVIDGLLQQEVIHVPIRKKTHVSKWRAFWDCTL